MMRGLLVKIFLCSILIEVLLRTAWITLGALFGNPHVEAERVVAQVLPLYAEVAAGALAHEGSAGLDAALERIRTESGLRLTWRPETAGCDGPSSRLLPAPGRAAGCLTAANLELNPKVDAQRRRWHELLPLMELLVCGGVSFLLARYLLQPIGDIARAAQGQGDLTARAGIRLGRRRDEIADLVRQFDFMADRIATLIETQRRFIGDVSHEIKSPLARLSMVLGLARREATTVSVVHFDRIEREVDRMSHLVQELLTLASLQARTAIQTPRSFDLRDLVAGVVDDLLFEREDRAPDVIVAKHGPRMMVTGDEGLLSRAVENVIRNALFYTAAGTQVRVSFDRARAGWVRLAVTDEGPGVPEHAVGRLFEPFYRVDDARARHTGGIGIGLSICERAVTLHGGQVRAANVSPHGLEVTIDVPAAAEGADRGGARIEGAWLSPSPRPRSALGRESAAAR